VVKTYGDLYLQARKTLLKTEDPVDAGMLARQLLCHVSGKTREEFLANRDLYASEAIEASLNSLVDRVTAGEPLAYILGEWEFYGLQLYVNQNVLIPRDDTVPVATLAINQALFLNKAPRILDLCTGSGCIGLAIASRVKDARVTLADLSKDALAVAKKNIQRHHLSGRVTCVQTNALQMPNSFLGKYDLIVSNPPYITTEEMKSLEKSVVDFEPHLALHGGDDGLVFYRSIAANYKNALNPGGYLCFEYGDTQADAVCAILEENGYTILERSRDYNHIDRAVIAQLRKEE
jgi:release factor glutamine methyltransferase